MKDWRIDAIHSLVPRLIGRKTDLDRAGLRPRAAVLPACLNPDGPEAPARILGLPVIWSDDRVGFFVDA